MLLSDSSKKKARAQAKSRKEKQQLGDVIKTYNVLAQVVAEPPITEDACASMIWPWQTTGEIHHDKEY